MSLSVRMWHVTTALLLLALATAQGYENTTRLTALSAEALTNLSKELVHLVKAERLSPLPGTVLAAVIRANPENSVLVGKCLMAARTPTQREQLLRALQNTHVLSETVQMELAAYMVHWFRDLETWKSERFLLTTRTGSPLLAYMPRTFLYYLSRANQDKFLYHLRAWRWTTSQEVEWSRKPRGVKRSWAEMMTTAAYPVPLKDLSKHEIPLQGFLLTGATPDELSQLQLRTRESRDYIMTLPLEPLQARAVFRTAFSTRSRRLIAPFSEHVTPVISLLTPAQIRSLDLSRVNLTGVGTADIKYKPSWATSVQLAYCLEEQASSVLNYVWSEGWSVDALSHVGQWLHALPRATLTRIFTTNPELLEDVARIHANDQVFRALDSSPLTAWQARLIVGHQLDAGPSSHFMLRLKGRLLLALNGTSVVQTSVSQLSQRALTHMLTYVPAESPAVFPLYLKSWSILDREWVLDAILASKDRSNFLSLLGTPDISPIAGKLRDAISRSRHSKLLPRHTLSLIMGHWRHNMTMQHKDWLNEIMKVPELLPGLRCEDIHALGSESALPVLVMLGDILRDYGVAYPRDLQHCALSALLKYMKTRKEIHNTESPLLQSLIKDKTKKVTLLDEFEPAEIYSVGGYVLASVPVAVLNSSSRWQHVIHAIGRLSVLELLEIFSADSNLHAGKLAELALRIEPREIGLATLDLLGNLIQFIPNPEQLVDRIAPRAFRLWLEGMDRREDTALCVSRVNKNTFWYRNILHSYGSAKNWTAGTLDSLGGLLVAVPNSALDQIPFSSWIEAADQLNLHNPYTKHFMQLCARILGPAEAHKHTASVSALMRRYLNASRALAATVRKVKPSESTSTTPETKNFFRFEAKIPASLPKILGARSRRNSNYNWFEKITTMESRENENGAIVPLEMMNEASISTTEMSPRARADVMVVESDSENQVSTTESNLIPDIFIESLQQNKTQEINNSRIILNCGAVRMSPVAAAMVLTEEDLEDLAQSGQLEDCLEVLGTLELSAVTTAAVWKVVQHWNVSVDIRDLGGLLSQVDLTVVHQANLSDLDVVTALGRHMETWHQMEQVVTMVLEANNVTDVLPEELAGALGTLTCGLFSLGTGTQLLTPPAFSKVYPLLATLLGNIIRCPPHPCLNGLMSIAVGPRVLGHVSTWSAEDVASLGILAAGFNPQHISSLQANAEAGISAQAVRCMAHESLKTFSTSQIGNLSLTALDAISPHVMTLLSPEQRSAVTAARSPPPHPLLKKTEVFHVPPPVLSSASTFNVFLYVILSTFYLTCQI